MQRSGRRASVAVEFALVAPVMLLLAGGVYEIGSLLRANAAVNRLAMQYAISYADCSDTSSGACQTELNEYITPAALGNIAPQLIAANLTLSMAQVKMTGTTPTVEYSNGIPLSAAQTSALQAAASPLQSALQASSTPAPPFVQTYVVVTATYIYQPLVFGAIMAPITGPSVTLSYTAVQLK